MPESDPQKQETEPPLNPPASGGRQESFDLRLLAPDVVRLFRSSPGDARIRLTLSGDRSWLNVTIACAFPFSMPDRYIGLRDSSGPDIGVLTELAGLDPESIALVKREIDRRYFTPTVLSVKSVVEQHGTITWQVETNRGPRRFVIRSLRDSAYPLGRHRLMLTDSEGNRYHFADITVLGRRVFDVLSKVM